MKICSGSAVTNSTMAYTETIESVDSNSHDLAETSKNISALNAELGKSKVFSPDSNPAGLYFECLDKNGIAISAGDIVKSPDGFTGIVVYANYALRYDIKDGQYLKYNSSLLYCDKWTPKDFEVVRWKSC